jgi:SAM-dependent methyltransferase
MSASKMAKSADYSSATELPRQGATDIPLSMLPSRYDWVAQHTPGKDVLEVACGAGRGLGWLAQRARRVAAMPEAHRGRANTRVQWMGALELPFEAGSFDVALLFEAQHYLPHLPRFLTEAQRVLRPGGALLISTVNCEWSGFRPSFLRAGYWNAVELLQALDDAAFKTRLYAGFAEHDGGGCGLRKLKAAASHLGGIPRRLRAKAVLKRTLGGRLDSIPKQLDSVGPAGSMIPVGSGADLTNCRTLYFEARSCR